MRLGLLLVVSLAVSCSSLFAQPPHTFTDVTVAEGIAPFDLSPYVMMAHGVAAADYDDDGDVDIYLPNGGGGAGHLYRNDGAAFFEVGSVSGLLGTGDYARCALWFDYDGDHMLDLLVGYDDYLTFSGVSSSLRLFRQDVGGMFTDVTAGSGLDFQDELGVHRTGLAAGDINNDGFLDLAVASWGSYARVFLNGGDGTFDDITASCGIGDHEFTWQPIFHDFDGDGRQDLHMMVDFEPNEMLINQGNNVFLDYAQYWGVDIAMNSMGVALCDRDNDLDFDLYVTNILFSDTYNVMLEQLAPGDFYDGGSGVQTADGGWSWGTTFTDVDLDGWPDLAVTNGWDLPAFVDDPSRLFMNEIGTGGDFVDAGPDLGFDDEHWGSSLVSFDYDRDGDFDLLQTMVASWSGGETLRLYSNNASEAFPNAGYLVVQPRMPGPNHRAIGATVIVRSGSEFMTRVITAGTSCMGQEPAEASFGLGGVSAVDSIEVVFPDGSRTTIGGPVTANRVLVVEPPSFIRGDSNGDGSVDIADVVYLLSFMFSLGADLNCRDAGDSDDNEVLDLSDAIYLLSYQVLQGTPPVTPFPSCGTDPTPWGGLPCRTGGSCP